MTKRRLYLWGLLLLLLGIFNSCRNDYLQDLKYRNEQENSKITSRIISLNQSTHKNKIAPLLSKLRQSYKSSALGKSANFGDSITINTDHVIFVENGPNYHTYTFSIERNNPSPNSPVENLVLSPLPDGTYLELYVVYNLSEQEKQKISNGEFVDTKNKKTIREIVNGNFSNALLSKSGMTVCGWVDTGVFVTECSEGVHGMWNQEEWGSCQADRKPGWHWTMTYRCDFIQDVSDSNNPGSGGTINPGGSGGGSPCTDCPPGGTTPTECVEVPSDPTIPSTGIGENGDCGVGIPSQIILPHPSQTPCQKIKTQRNDEEFKKRMDTLQSKTGLQKETGYIQKWGGTYEYKSNAGSNSEANTLSLPPVATNTYIKGFNHTHVDDYDFTDPSDGLVKTKIGIKIPSPADVGYFMDLVQNAQTFNHPLDDVYGGMISSGNNYQIRFTGNQYQIKTFTDEQTEAHREPYRDFMKDFIDKPKKLELGFLWYISEKMNLKGVTLYRLNADGTTTEIKLNATKTDTVETTCPN